MVFQYPQIRYLHMYTWTQRVPTIPFIGVFKFCLRPQISSWTVFKTMTFSLGYRELLRQQKVAHHLTALLRFFLIKIIGTCDEKLQNQYREVQNEEQKASTCTLPKEHVPIHTRFPCIYKTHWLLYKDIVEFLLKWVCFLMWFICLVFRILHGKVSFVHIILLFY